MTDFVSDLDKTFAEAAARMSAQLDQLTRTETVIVEKDVLDVPGPLDGYAKEHFFEPAIALSGQDLGLIEAQYNVVSEVWTQSDDKIDEFQTGMLHVLDRWDGTAALACAVYVGSLRGFVTSERDSLWNFAQCLVAYGAIIRGARNSLKQLMDACASGWEQATRAGEVGSVSVAITTLTGIMSVGVGVGTGGAALGPFLNAVTNVLGATAKNDIDLSGKHADIADAYLRGARELIDQASEAIDQVALPRLNGVRDSLPHVPALPSGINDRNTFHP